MIITYDVVPHAERGYQCRLLIDNEVIYWKDAKPIIVVNTGIGEYVAHFVKNGNEAIEGFLSMNDDTPNIINQLRDYLRINVRVVDERLSVNASPRTTDTSPLDH